MYHRSSNLQSTSHRASRSRNAHHMSSPFKRNLSSRRARRLYRRILNDGEGCSLRSLEMSRDLARALSAVRPRNAIILTRSHLTLLVTEIEGFFNLLYAHLLKLWPIDSPEIKNRVSNLLPIITSSTGVSAAKYRMCVFRLTHSIRVSRSRFADMSISTSRSLSNLFNTLPRQSTLRHPVYTALLKLASSNDELHVLQVSRSDVEKWLKEWDITPTEKSAFLKTLVDTFSKAGQRYVQRLRVPHRLDLLEQRHGLLL
jgi:hypothetical protein